MHISVCFHQRDILLLYTLTAAQLHIGARKTRFLCAQPQPVSAGKRQRKWLARRRADNKCKYEKGRVRSRRAHLTRSQKGDREIQEAVDATQLSRRCRRTSVVTTLLARLCFEWCREALFQASRSPLAHSRPASPPGLFVVAFICVNSSESEYASERDGGRPRSLNEERCSRSETGRQTLTT